MSDPAMTDHAELARMAEAAYHDYALSHISVGGGMRATVSVPAFIAAANPARVLALLAEIEAMRVDRDEWRNWYRKASVEINERTDRATQAERQRDELAKQISMDDVRLAAGEGQLGASTVLAAVNAIIRTRANRYASMEPKITSSSVSVSYGVGGNNAPLSADHVSDARQMVQPEQIAENANCSPTDFFAENAKNPDAIGDA